MTSITIPDRLDEIAATIGDREPVARRSVASMTDAEMLALMLAPLLASEGRALALDAIGDEVANLRIVRSGHRMCVTLGEPGDLALVVLEDRDVALVSNDVALHHIWGPPLVVTASRLLLALQYARDDADYELYRPAAYRDRNAEAWGLPAAMLRSISANRDTLMHGASRPVPDAEAS